MEAKNADILLWILFLGLLLCLGMIVRQHWRYSELALETETSVATLEQELRELNGFNTELQQRVEGLERARLAQSTNVENKQLENSAPGSSNITGGSTSNSHGLSGLASGLYTLEREVEIEDSRRKKEIRPFTIYHFKTSVSVGEDSYKISLGFATSGYSVPRFYIDYNDDGLVDADMMQDYVHYLPLGGIMAKSMDPIIAQAIYNAFMQSHQEAKYISANNIKGEGGEVANKLWSFVEGSSAEMASWIKRRLGGEESPSGQTSSGREKTDARQSPAAAQR